MQRLLTVAAGGRITLTSIKLSLNLPTGAALKDGLTRYSSQRVRARVPRRAAPRQRQLIDRTNLRYRPITVGRPESASDRYTADAQQRSLFEIVR